MRPRSLALLALLLSVSSAAAVELPPQNERWSRLALANNIVIYSNASNRDTRAVAENLIRFRDTVAQVQQLPVQSPLPTYVYVFAGEGSFAPYRTAALGRKANDVIGVFSQHAGANWMLMQARSDVTFDRLIYHELTHSFIRNTLRSVRPWLDEGLASFYETFAPMGKSDVVTIGKLPRHYIDILRDTGLAPLQEVFTTRTINHDSGDSRTMQFYLQTWMLMHYLLIGNPERGAALGPFIAALDEGQPLEKAFAGAFHMKMEDLNAEVSAYLRRDRFNMIQYSVKPSGEKIGDPAPMPRDETLFALGNLLANIDPAAGADAFLAEALRVNPNHAAAAALLAGLKEGDAARQLEEKAIANAGNDPRPYVTVALRAIASAQRRERAGQAIDRAEIERARGYAEKALALAPDDVMANAVFGASFSFAGEDAKKGIAASRHAWELAPSMLDVAADLVLLYARAGLPALALQMLDKVIVPSGNEAMIEEAKANLKRATASR